MNSVTLQAAIALMVLMSAAGKSKEYNWRQILDFEDNGKVVNRILKPLGNKDGFCPVFIPRRIFASDRPDLSQLGVDDNTNRTQYTFEIKCDTIANVSFATLLADKRIASLNHTQLFDDAWYKPFDTQEEKSIHETSFKYYKGIEDQKLSDEDKDFVEFYYALNGAGGLLGSHTTLFLAALFACSRYMDLI